MNDYENVQLNDRKKLKEQYKQMKPDMGVFMFKCIPSDKAYLGIGQNLKADINSIKFQLNLGSYPTNNNLQNDWKEHGADNFEILILEILKYDNDEAKTDYMKDLRMLRELCTERFDKFEFIQK